MVQTFMPYPDFVRTAECLDWRRLGRQRTECKMILDTLDDIVKRPVLPPNGTKTRTWRNHPAVKMWQGYETALKLYMNAVIREWIKRGYVNNIDLWNFDEVAITVQMPKWFGDDRLHSSHRAALLKKAPEFYSQYGWAEEPQIAYFWPV